MTIRKRIKLFQRAAARRCMFSFAWLVEHLPFPLVRFILRNFLRFALLVTRRHHRVAAETIRLAFGREKSPDEIRRIIDGCFFRLREGMIDLLHCSRYPERVRGRFFYEGREHLEEALGRGRGVVAVTAHFGNFPLMMLFLAQEGYSVHVIMRRARDPEVADFVLKVMTRTGVRTIYTHPRQRCIAESLRVLRDNGILFIMPDQHFGAGGVEVPFFGRPAATATGPVVLAERTGAVLLPMFNILEPDGRRRIVVERPLEMEVGGDPEERVHRNTARLTEVIERYVRAYPAEWGWMHRRWKNEATTG